MKLPKSIGDMISLETLYLSGNKLTSVPSSFERLKGTDVKIYLTGNPLRKFGIGKSLGITELKNLFGEDFIFHHSHTDKYGRPRKGCVLQ